MMAAIAVIFKHTEALHHFDIPLLSGIRDGRFLHDSISSTIFPSALRALHVISGNVWNSTPVTLQRPIESSIAVMSENVTRSKQSRFHTVDARKRSTGFFVQCNPHELSQNSNIDFFDEALEDAMTNRSRN